MRRKGKEEDRIEAIIRGLLKEPDNRRCINCNSMGPQYVCTTFWTFVCTSCSGVHREFSHRVKSVSMAKFKSEEISNLQAGGNERARQIYFKAWDPERNVYPDASNLHKLREFIRHVYIDRRYAGQNSYDRPSMVKSDSRYSETSSYGKREDFLEIRSSERSGSSRTDEYERRSSDKSSPSRRSGDKKLDMFEERRSPQQIQENVRSVGHRSRPSAHFEIVDDRFRDDGGVKLYDRYKSSKEPRSRSRSPGSGTSRKMILPAVQPVKDVIGEKVPPLRIAEPPKANVEPPKAKDAEPPKANVVKDAESPAKVQAAGASSADSTNEKQKQENTVNFSSLIDFDASPEPNSSTAEPQAQTTILNNNIESSSAPLSVNEKPVTNASSLNSVESLLFDLSTPVATPSVPNSSEGTYVGSNQAHEVSNNAGNLALTVVGNDQSWHSKNNDSMALVPQNFHESTASNDQRLVPSVPFQQSLQAPNSEEGSKPPGRQELPADLFALNFGPFTPAAPGWQMRPPHGMGYGMPFRPPAMPMAGFPNPANPRNPFDFGGEQPQVQAAAFPSMSPIHGALPNMGAIASLQPQHSPYGAPFSSQVSPYGMNMPPGLGAYMGQQPNNMPFTRPQGIGGIGSGQGQDAFASLNPIQQGTGTGSITSAPNYSTRNPFG